MLINLSVNNLALVGESFKINNQDADDNLEMNWNFEPLEVSFLDSDLPKNIKHFQKTLSEINNSSANDLKQLAFSEFQAIETNSSKLCTEKNGFELLSYYESNVYEKNRYVDILPYKNNYIGKENFEGYVNASKISMHGVNYIATQGPLPSTIVDFFRMVKDFDGTIVTLANEYEKGCLKCHNYWLPENSIFVDGWKLTLVEENNLYSNNDQFMNQLVQKRTFTLSKDQNADKVITQFHYVNWPDLGIPESDVFDKLLEAVEEHHSSKKPIITHCSAGIGRTGTFIASHSIRNKIRLKLHEGLKKEDIPVNFVEDILTMRLQRMGLVQTREQLSSVKEAIFRYQKSL